jgi:hypothetical protein
MTDFKNLGCNCNLSIYFFLLLVVCEVCIELRSDAKTVTMLTLCLIL